MTNHSSLGGVRSIRSLPSKKPLEPTIEYEEPVTIPFTTPSIPKTEELPQPLPIISPDISDLLPVSTRPLGVTIIGQTGMGKTTLLESLIRHDMENGITVVVLDAHGDLSQELLAYASNIMPDRTILLEIQPETPFGLNIYECPDYHSIVAIDRTVDTVVQLFRKQWGEDRLFFPRIEYVIKNTARTILANPGYTMLEIPLLFRNEAFRNKLVSNVKNPEVLQFWEDYNGRSPYLKNELTESSILRISQFLQSEFVQRVVSQSHTTIPFADIFSKSGQLLLINLAIGRLGEGITSFIGSMIISAFTNLIYEREKLPMDQRSRVHLYIDEYGRFASASTAALAKEGRKFNIGSVFAFQTLSDLPDQENRSALMQTGSTVLFQIIGEDAIIFAPEFADPPQEAWEEEIAKEWEEELEEEWVEIVKPQRHERVEEQVAIEVEEDIRSISSNPVDYLLSMRGTHENRLIRKLIQTVLSPLEEEIRFARQEDEEEIRSKHYLVSSETDRIYRKKEFINQLLIAMMEEEIQTGTEIFADKIKELTEISFYLKFDGHTLLLMRKHDFIRTLVLGQDAERIERDFIKVIIAQGWYETERAIQELKRLVFFVINVISLCKELAREPILVPTGQKRMVKRIQPHITYLPHESEKINHPRIAIVHPRKTISHPQRTYADMVNEKAQELASLPRFICLIQSIDEQGQVRRQLMQLPPPVQVGLSPAGINQIIANSQKYYRNWVEVEQEIQKRQTIPPVERDEAEKRPTEEKSKEKSKTSKRAPLERGKPLQL